MIKLTGHRKILRSRRNILILGMLLCFSNNSKIFAIEVQQTKAMLAKRHVKITKYKEIENVALQYECVLHFKGWEERSGTICLVLGKQAFLPLKSQFLWCLLVSGVHLLEQVSRQVLWADFSFVVFFAVNCTVRTCSCAFWTTCSFLLGMAVVRQAGKQNQDFSSSGGGLKGCKALRVWLL